MNTTTKQELALYNLLENKGIEEVENVFKRLFAYSFGIRVGEELFNKTYSTELFEHLYNGNRQGFMARIGDFLTTVEYEGYEKDSVFNEAVKFIDELLEYDFLKIDKEHLYKWLHENYCDDAHLSGADWISVMNWYVTENDDHIYSR